MINISLEQKWNSNAGENMQPIGQMGCEPINRPYRLRMWCLWGNKEEKSSTGNRNQSHAQYWNPWPRMTNYGPGGQHDTGTASGP